jgi:hypothetical protein
VAAVPLANDVTPNRVTLAARNSDVSAGWAAFSWLAIGCMAWGNSMAGGSGRILKEEQDGNDTHYIDDEGTEVIRSSTEDSTTQITRDANGHATRTTRDSRGNP